MRCNWGSVSEKWSLRNLSLVVSFHRSVAQATASRQLFSAFWTRPLAPTRSFRDRVLILGFEFLGQLLEPIEILFQTGHRIEVGVIEDADRAFEIHLPDEFENFLVSIPLSDRQDLFAYLIPLGLHPVEIDRQEKGLDLFEVRFELIELMVSMVQVVDDSDVRQIDGLDESDLVIGFSVPAAVVVQSDFATRFLSR